MTTMTLEKPERVYVQVRNGRTGKSCTRTFYGCNEIAAMAEIVRAMKEREAAKAAPRRREKQTA